MNPITIPTRIRITSSSVIPVVWTVGLAASADTDRLWNICIPLSSIYYEVAYHMQSSYRAALVVDLFFCVYQDLSLPLFSPFIWWRWKLYPSRTRPKFIGLVPISVWSVCICVATMQFDSHYFTIRESVSTSPHTLQVRSLVWYLPLDQADQEPHVCSANLLHSPIWFSSLTRLSR